MRNRCLVLLLLATLSLPMCGCTKAAATSPQEAGLTAITSEHSKMYVEILADDALNGRSTGTPGSVVASELIAGWLEEIGAVPFQEDSYFQKFDRAQVRELDARRQPELGVCNILGKIEGENPDEFVFVGAHYDHISTRPNAEGNDNIFNGADDNASGVAGVLQIACAFIALGVKPQRTVVFAFWDAEERGRLGSFSFCRTFEDIDKIKAYFNFDMIGRDESGTGGQVSYYSTDTTIPWARIVVEDAIGYNLNVEPVTDPEILAVDFRPIVILREMEGRRVAVMPGLTDYEAFQIAGIPVYHMSTGLHSDYHKPGDEAHKIDYRKMTDISKLAFLTLYRLANPE